MFDLNPLGRPVAVVEILLLLTLAAVVGWFLARLLLNNRINALRAAIADHETELDDCRRTRLVVSTPKNRSAMPKVEPISTGKVDVVPTVSSPEPVRIPPVLAEPEASLTLAPEHPIIEPIVIASTPAAIVGNSESAVLQRIAARANELNFDRIGLASASEADDLKDIVGIGPFLERKLHSLGIYTFRQVANFQKEDIDKVNEIIEFFPGRIERDNWVDQSKTFYERKYGSQLENK